MHEHIERLSTQLAEVANSQGALTPFQVRTLRTRIGVEPLGLHCVLTLCFRAAQAPPRDGVQLPAC